MIRPTRYITPTYHSKESMEAALDTACFCANYSDWSGNVIFGSLPESPPYRFHIDCDCYADVRLIRGWLNVYGARQLPGETLVEFNARINEELTERYVVDALKSGATIDDSGIWGY